MPKGSDLLVAALANEGVERIFGVPGEENLDVVESLRTSKIKLILTRHEQAAAFMSGTAYGTIVLHISPEAAVGGPLGAVRDGDRIALSIAKKRIDLKVDDAEVKRRIAANTRMELPQRGYAALYRRSVLQAPRGCDFDFLSKAGR